MSIIFISRGMIYVSLNSNDDTIIINQYYCLAQLNNFLCLLAKHPIYHPAIFHLTMHNSTFSKGKISSNNNNNNKLHN